MDDRTLTAEEFLGRYVGAQSHDGMMVAAALAYQDGDYEAALKVYRGVQIARPAWSRPVTGEGACLYCLGDAPGAEAAYRRGLELDPGDQEARLYLGELIWNERRDAKAAESQLSMAFNHQPESLLAERARIILQRIRRNAA